MSSSRILILAATASLMLAGAAPFAPANAYDPCVQATKNHKEAHAKFMRYIRNQCGNAKRIPQQCKHPRRGERLYLWHHQTVVKVRQTCG